MDAAFLLPLRDRVASLAVPCEVHPGVCAIDEGAAGWARRAGLVTGEAGAGPLRPARFGRMAARIFPAAPVDRVELYARWLTWLFAFDDARDESPLGASATAVDALYSGLLMALRRGHARPEAGPLEVSFIELWEATAPLTSANWRQRFLGHLEEHRRSCAEEAVHRRTGHIPDVAEYPALRRRTGGLFMFDLAEPVLGFELPDAVIRSPVWQSLLQGTADLIAWCNDVVSYPKESRHGAAHNYLTVLAHAFGLSPDQTMWWVLDRIAERAPEVMAAQRQLPATYLRLGLDTETVRQADRAARILVSAPRAHLDWLLESGRYRTHEQPCRLAR